MRNEYKYYIHLTLWSIVLMFTNGAVLQTFLLENGIPEHSINIFISCMQIIQIFTMLCISERIDRAKNIISLSAFGHFLDIPIICLLVFMCFVPDLSVSIKLVMLFVAGVIHNISIGACNILTYKLPYHIISLNKYAKVTSVSGVITGISTLLFSVLLSYLWDGFGYIDSMRYIYIATLIVLGIYIITTKSLKRIDDNNIEQASENKKINLFKYKPFYKLILPNLLRGFCLGIIGMTVTIGYYHERIDVSSASFLVVITNFTTILGCLLYRKIAGWSIEKEIVLISSIVCVVTMPLMITGNSAGSFLVFYGISYFCINLINYAIPVALTRIVDYNVIGQYSAWRMLLTTFGTAMAGFVCIGMFEVFGGVTAMLLVGTAQLLSGVGYYVNLKGESYDVIR